MEVREALRLNDAGVPITKLAVQFGTWKTIAKELREARNSRIGRLAVRILDELVDVELWRTRMSAASITIDHVAPDKSRSFLNFVR